MRISFDVVTRALSFDASDAEPWGGDLEAHIARYGQRLDIRGLSFGVTVTSDNVEILSRTWPPAGVKFSRTDQDVLLTERLRWNSDDAIVINAWLRIRDEEHTASWNLTAPRPDQPFPSWTWTGTAWEAPVAYPGDGGPFTWDEPSQSWVPEAAP